tara:strand:+ start:595 stop:1506 length:912 start_codon:yes stop_codon:yes gene_type:complete
MKRLFLICISLLIGSSDSIDFKIIENMIKNQKIDTSNIVIDFNKGMDINFIPQDPSKNRISDKALIDKDIDEIKKNARDYKVSDLNDKEVVVIETSKGVIKIKLFNNVAPKHCLNFKKLCNSGFYDYTSFHRVIRDFMIQGGDILSRDKDRSNDGFGSPGWSVDAEFSDISHSRGIVSMARSNDINSAGSQFFICIKDTPSLDGKYTVFGQVVEGMDIVDKISTVPTDRDLMLKSSSIKIPEGEDKENWIEISDYDSRKMLYFKIPQGETRSSYYNLVKQDLRSNNPYRRVEITKARVYVESN